MVTDQQVRRLKKLRTMGYSQDLSALKAGMGVKTARRYLTTEKLPSELKPEHNWKTRENPFSDDWPEIEDRLKLNEGLEAKTIFEYLQRKYPDKYSDGQLRTLQRRFKEWRALNGPPLEVFFEQVHKPGELSQSDFTHMGNIGVTIQGKSFEHLIYHFVLTYSNWETGSICYSESYESLSEGLQNALWELGGVPQYHRTDSLSSAVNNLSETEEFTSRYKALLSHYRLRPQRINVGKANENGDVEQSHHRFKRALAQNLMLRGSYNFESIEEYDDFLRKLFKQVNYRRQENLAKELEIMKQLPLSRLTDCRVLEVRVSKGSTIRALHNSYSVPASFIGEWVKVKVYSKEIEVWYAQKMVQKMPRMKGEGKAKINYRHIIDWLVRKPGAFENYRYREDMFPTSYFRIAYDSLKQAKEYLKILYLAAKENEGLVDDAIRALFDTQQEITYEKVEAIVYSAQKVKPVTDVFIAEMSLFDYDGLLEASYG
jgi:transposase